MWPKRVLELLQQQLLESRFRLKGASRRRAILIFRRRVGRTSIPVPRAAETDGLRTYDRNDIRGARRDQRARTAGWDLPALDLSCAVQTADGG